MLAAKSIKTLTIIFGFALLAMLSNCTLISDLLWNLRIQIFYSCFYIACADKAP